MLPDSMARLSHLDARGRVRMVDVSAKAETAREAVARGSVRMAAATLRLLRAGRTPKGNVLATAHLAAVMAAKRTDEWIPLAHPLRVEAVEVTFTFEPRRPGVAIEAKVRTAYTDPKKLRKDDPGNPDGCVVFAYHRAFNAAGAPAIDAACRAGKLGCVADKKDLSRILAERLAPIRERRQELAAHPERVREALRHGEEKARAVARETMREVREAMKIG